MAFETLPIASLHKTYSFDVRLAAKIKHLLTPGKKLTEIHLTLRFEGGDADQGRMLIYDAAESLYGLARSLNIATHAFANDEKIRKRGDQAHGAEIQIEAPNKGCFEEHVYVKFDGRVEEKIGSSVIRSRYWDFLQWSWSSAVGLDFEPKYPSVAALNDSENGIAEEMAIALESSFAKMLKPIAQNPDEMKLILGRPKMGDIMTFDWNDLQYVSVQEISDEQVYIVGNVTRANLLSGFGRLYDDNLRKVVSFESIEDPSQRMKSILIKSMQDRVAGLEGKLHFKVSAYKNAKGDVKRYLVHDVLEIVR